MSSFRNKIVKFLVRLGVEKAANYSVPQLREMFENDSKRFSKRPPGTIVQPFSIGDCPAEWIGIGGLESKSVILYFHGGAFIFGSLNSHRNSVSQFALAAQAKVLNIGYRLSPENTFPAALDDATAAYSWLLEQGYDPRRIVVAGDSAGGGLALALLMKLRDLKRPMPAAGVLISPWTDLTGSGESMQQNVKADPLLRRDKLNEWARMYVGQADARHPYVSPLFGDFHGLVPLWICASTHELLYSDGVRTAEKAQAAGLQVQLVIGDEMIHVWPIFSGMIPEAKECVINIGEFIHKKAA